MTFDNLVNRRRAYRALESVEIKVGSLKKANKIGDKIAKGIQDVVDKDYD